MKLEDVDGQNVAAWLEQKAHKEDDLLGGQTPGIRVSFSSSILAAQSMIPLGDTVKEVVDIQVPDLAWYRDLDSFLEQKTPWKKVLGKTSKAILAEINYCRPDTTASGPMTVMNAVENLEGQGRPVGSVLLAPELRHTVSVRNSNSLVVPLKCLAIAGEAIAVHTDGDDAEYLIVNHSDADRENVQVLRVTLALQVFRKGTKRPTASRVVWKT